MGTQRHFSRPTPQASLPWNSPGQLPRLLRISQSRQGLLKCLGQAEGGDPRTAVIFILPYWQQITSLVLVPFQRLVTRVAVPYSPVALIWGNIHVTLKTLIVLSNVTFYLETGILASKVK